MTLVRRAFIFNIVISLSASPWSGRLGFPPKYWRISVLNGHDARLHCKTRRKPKVSEINSGMVMVVLLLSVCFWVVSVFSFFHLRHQRSCWRKTRVDSQQSILYKFFTQAYENSKTPISFSPFSRITHESKPTDIIQKFCALSKSPQTIPEIVIVSRSIYIYRHKFALAVKFGR